MSERSFPKGLMIFGGSVVAVMLLGGLFNPGRGDTRAWYDGLEKPSLTPPDWLFGPVWTVLYILIAIAGRRVWNQTDSSDRSVALRWWTVQMAANAAWSPLFFGAKRPTPALVIIVLMVITIAGFIFTSRKVDKAAPWMFAPYLLWVSFATYLNAEIARRN